MKTTSKDGARKFEFLNRERDDVDATLSVLDDMKRYPERFPDADDAHDLLSKCRELMGTNNTKPAKPPKK